MSTKAKNITIGLAVGVAVTAAIMWWMKHKNDNATVAKTVTTPPKTA